MPDSLPCPLASLGRNDPADHPLGSSCGNGWPTAPIVGRAVRSAASPRAAGGGGAGRPARRHGDQRACAGVGPAPACPIPVRPDDRLRRAGRHLGSDDRQERRRDRVVLPQPRAQRTVRARLDRVADGRRPARCRRVRPRPVPLPQRRRAREPGVLRVHPLHRRALRPVGRAFATVVAVVAAGPASVLAGALAVAVGGRRAHRLRHLLLPRLLPRPRRPERPAGRAPPAPSHPRCSGSPTRERTRPG